MLLWILMTHHYKPFYKLGQSNRTDWQTGLFVLLWKGETPIKQHALSIPISVYIVRQQGQSGSYLPETLANLTLAFKCFGHVIILLLPLLWFIGGKSRHIFHLNTRFSCTKRRSVAFLSLSAEKMKPLNLCCCSSTPVCVVVPGNGGWISEQVHMRGLIGEVNACFETLKGNFQFQFHRHPKTRRIRAAGVWNTGWRSAISISVSARCSKGDNTGSIQAAALLIYSHFTQVQSYRSGLRGSTGGSAASWGKKIKITATDHKNNIFKVDIDTLVRREPFTLSSSSSGQQTELLLSYWSAQVISPLTGAPQQ